MDESYKPGMAKTRDNKYDSIKFDEWMFDDITGICFVVKDLMVAVKEYCDVYGVGPWNIYEHKDVEGIFHGKPEKFSFKQAKATIKKVEIDLIQPLEGNSTYSEFLEKYNSGLHYVRVKNQVSKEKLLEAFKSTGAEVLEEYSLNGERLVITNHMEVLGNNFAVDFPDESVAKVEPCAVYPDETYKSVYGYTPENPMITNIFQISLILKDHIKAAKEYYDVYGIGPWAILKVDKTNAAQVIHHGHLSDHDSIECVQFIGDMNINLTAPRDEESTFGELLKKYGPRAHHICIDCSNGYEGAMNVLEAYSGEPAAFTCIMDGCEPVAFVDRMETLGTFFEVKCIPRGYTKPVLIGSYPEGVDPFDY